MSALKNVLFTLLVVLALAGGAWAYLKLREIKKPSEDALQRLPADCSIYLYTQDLLELNNRLNTRSLIIDKFAELSPLSDFLPALERFCEGVSEHPVLEENISDNGIHFALYPEKREWLISFNLKELGQERNFQTAFSETFASKKIDIELYSFEFAQLGLLYVNYRKGGVCISNSKQSIEAALDPAVPRLKQDSAFKLCSADFEEAELLSVYLAHDRLSGKKQSLRFNALQNSGYTSGQLEVQPSQLIFNGLVIPGENTLFKKLLQQRPTGPELELMLPNTCTAFQAYGFQDCLPLLDEGQNLKFWKTVSDSAGLELSSGFYKNTLLSICEYSVSNSPGKFLVAGLADTISAQEQLEYMSDSILVDGENKLYRVIALPEPPRLFEPLSSAKCAFAFVFNTYLYVAENQEAALWLLQTMREGKTFEKNRDLMAYAREQFPETFSVLKYISPSSRPESIRDFYPAASKSKEETFQGLKHVSLSLVAQEREFKMRWHCSFENEIEESGEQFLWTLKLDTNCNMAPQKFVNHISGEEELLVQDEANALYLINSKGKILWKKQLNEKIRSKIYMVDMFRNGKNQMLFSSDNYLHLIDRNSNYIETYPVKTPAKLSSPLCVFDYEESRDYRLFFACTNKKIYNYTIYGIRNERFTPVKTEEEVQVPIQYIKVGASDYLLALDREGKIYGFSRKGELRLQLSNRTLVPCRDVYVDVTKSLQSTKLIFADEKSGGIHRISLADKKEILDLKEVESILCYSFALVDENRNMDLVMAGTESISAYNLNGTRLFETKTPIELSELGFYTDQNHTVYYGWSKNNAELYLYESRKNESLSLKAGAMPLFSNLFKNNKIYLVFPEQDRLNCLAY
ncbi:MAG: hypothetical protein JNK73_08355 [Bacteroidia bacterium]|nr:hypothetical protein [Bacteroidia bacterium]